MTNDQSWVKLIGFDPGTETLGLSILTMDIRTRAILKLEAVTLRGSKLFDDEGFHAGIQGVRTARIQALKRKIQTVFVQEQPLNVACESSFFNRMRPSAYAPLLEIVAAIREAVIEYDQWVRLYLIDPPTVKKAVGAAHNADKNAVKVALKKNYAQYFQGGAAEVEAMDEHSVDACAVIICRYWGIIQNVF